VRFKENPKLDAVEAVLGEIGGAKIVICHYYTETGQMLCDRLKLLKIKHQWLHGGTKDKVGAKRIFMEDPACQVFVMNTEAGGTGNDGLQKVAKYMLFYESPTRPDTRKQVEKRIHRPGQNERSFFIDLVMRKSMDKTILDNIEAGVDLYEAVVNGRRMARDLFGG
jgi:SNF2 family DNA or RNA helicase